MFERNGHIFTMPENDKRSIPYGAADTAFDVDGFHWKDGDPSEAGYYMVALSVDPSSGSSGSHASLPVEKAYYDGKEWSRRKCSRKSLLREKYYLDEGYGGCLFYLYDIEYWCEIPDSGELLPCLLNY